MSMDIEEIRDAPLNHADIYVNKNSSCIYYGY